jgi:alpha-beta hydrolase superfamily lysophospholipase
VTVTFPPRIAQRWEPAEGLVRRGTVVVLPGRGEHGEVYERLGRRLAYDAYEVVALDALPTTPVEELVVLVRSLIGSPQPVVLVGSDTGGLEALQIAALADDVVAAVVVAGVAASSLTTPDWDAELEVRTACPVHRARLSADERFDRGGLDQPVPEQLTTSSAVFGGPVLVLHGDADRVTPVAEAAELAARLPLGRLVSVSGGRHDVLNDLAHRSVAAEIVQLLERVRLGADSPAILGRAS